jgi:hypothetical protein
MKTRLAYALAPHERAIRFATMFAAPDAMVWSGQMLAEC